MPLELPQPHNQGQSTCCGQVTGQNTLAHSNRLVVKLCFTKFLAKLRCVEILCRTYLYRIFPYRVFFCEIYLSQHATIEDCT